MGRRYGCHRIEIFDGADDDAVVVFYHATASISYSFSRSAIHQSAARWLARGPGRFWNCFRAFFTVVSDTAAGAAHGETIGRTSAREATCSGNRQRFFHSVRDAGTARCRGQFSSSRYRSDDGLRLYPMASAVAPIMKRRRTLRALPAAPAPARSSARSCAHGRQHALHPDALFQ